ncbi:hypothetical protein CISIN_1g045033mg [Citrus sinensis]|uniref:Uncharacterized protein n=1 Tax=Citrus sinensis TaxID=2711 RepID=A0A067DPS3_CITSI|nr:hypothetical protein CISIN_1g045033mg [Citrus sinensis]
MGEPCFVGECGQEMEGTGRKEMYQSEGAYGFRLGLKI